MNTSNYLYNKEMQCNYNGYCKSIWQGSANAKQVRAFVMLPKNSEKTIIIDHRSNIFTLILLLFKYFKEISIKKFTNKQKNYGKKFPLRTDRHRGIFPTKMEYLREFRWIWWLVDFDDIHKLIWQFGVKKSGNTDFLQSV